MMESWFRYIWCTVGSFYDPHEGPRLDEQDRLRLALMIEQLKWHSIQFSKAVNRIVENLEALTWARQWTIQCCIGTLLILMFLNASNSFDKEAFGGSERRGCWGAPKIDRHWCHVPLELIVSLTKLRKGSRGPGDWETESSPQCIGYSGLSQLLIGFSRHNF